jgi:hypothetical protein
MEMKAESDEDQERGHAFPNTQQVQIQWLSFLPKVFKFMTSLATRPSCSTLHFGWHIKDRISHLHDIVLSRSKDIAQEHWSDAGGTTADPDRV